MNYDNYKLATPDSYFESETINCFSCKKEFSEGNIQEVKIMGQFQNLCCMCKNDIPKHNHSTIHNLISRGKLLGFNSDVLFDFVSNTLNGLTFIQEGGKNE